MEKRKFLYCLGEKKEQGKYNIKKNTMHCAYLEDDEGEGVADEVGLDRLHVRTVEVSVLK